MNIKSSVQSENTRLPTAHRKITMCIQCDYYIYLWGIKIWIKPSQFKFPVK